MNLDFAIWHILANLRKFKTMNVYYNKVTVFCKYPFNQEVDYRYVRYSTSKRKFNKKIFMETDVALSIHERKKAVSEKLNIKESSIKLIKK